MTSDDLADDVRRFIVERIDSIELLEVLLALRAAAGRPVTAEAIARALGSNTRSIEARLATLAGLRIAGAADGGWRYAPAEPALDDLVDRLAKAYRERRLTVINLIYSPKPSDVTLFSDAFRLRDPKRKEDDR